MDAGEGLNAVLGEDWSHLLAQGQRNLFGGFLGSKSGLLHGSSIRAASVAIATTGSRI